MKNDRALLIVGLVIYMIGFAGVITALGSPLTNWTIPKSFTPSDHRTLLAWSVIVVLVGTTLAAYSRKRNH